MLAQNDFPLSILPTQNFVLMTGEAAWGIEPIIWVGVEPASEKFWVNLFELRNGQERLCDIFRRWQPWLNDLAQGVTGSIHH